MGGQNAFKMMLQSFPNHFRELKMDSENIIGFRGDKYRDMGYYMLRPFLERVKDEVTQKWVQGLENFRDF